MIQRSTFANCSSLSKVDIPSSTTEIGGHAFHNCASLTSIKLPTGIQKICSFAFKTCESLESIQIPSSIESIGRKAFEDCYSLKVIYIPSSFLKGRKRVTFDESPNLIILTDINESEYESEQHQHPITTLRKIEQCVENIPNDVTVDEQVDSVQQAL